MRKLLMASAAVLGATGGLAQAQTPPPASANPSQGQLAAPYGAGPAANNNNNAWGIANTPTGSAAAGPLSTVYAPNVDAVPAPGTIVIRLNGRLVVDFTANYTSADKSVNAEGAATGYKLNPLGVAEYARLYPAFDGLAANGLRYGASIEIRENYTSGTYPGQPNGITAPAASVNTAATSSSTNSSGETLFIRRAFGYVAADSAGLLRVGQTDGVIGLFDNCIFSSQCWDITGEISLNGSSLQSTSAQAGLGIPFYWLAQAGADYGNAKIVYLTPQYYGFDFGVQYAPSMGDAFQDTGAGVGCTQAAAQCVNVTSGSDATRWYNQVGLGLRYQQSFGPVDFKAFGFYETAAKEDLTVGAYITPAAARAGGSTSLLRYNNLSYYMGGAAVTAYNVTLAVDYVGGRVNGQNVMVTSGGVNQNAIVAGATYFNGPLSLGAEFAVADAQGAVALTGVSQRHEYEAAFGGGYRIAPGLAFIAGYLYEHRHQGDFNFATGAAGTGTRDAQSNSFLTALAFNW